MACAPEAHADTVPKFGPLNPNWIDTCPAAMSEIIIGMKNGLTRPGPFSSCTECWLSKVSMPPIPDPMSTPTRSRSSVSRSSPEVLSASWLATTNSLLRDVLQVGWDRMTTEQRDVVRLAALSQLLIEQRGMPQAMVAERAHDVLTAWHTHSPAAVASAP